MRVLLTGPTGLVGRGVLRELLHGGHAVTALALPETVRELPTHPLLTVVTGSIEEHTRLAVAAHGNEVVIHAAGLLPGSPPTELARINVDGTENVLLAAAEARVRRFVFLSSTAVYGPAPVRAWPLPEEHALTAGTRGSVAYGVSKVTAEALVTRFRRRHRLECAILRPPTVYGRGSAGAERTLRAVLQRPLTVLSAPFADEPMQWVHVDDLAAAVVAAATRRPLGWIVCNVAGGELFDLHVLRRVALGLEPVQRPRLRRLPLRYDLTRARDGLGWQPAVSQRAGVRDMVVSLR